MYLEENSSVVQTALKDQWGCGKIHIRTNISEFDDFRVDTPLPSSDFNHRIPTFMLGLLNPVLKFNRGVSPLRGTSGNTVAMETGQR